MTEIYLIRHGEAEGNLYRRMQGQYDSNLTDLGWKQIAALGERFRDIPLDGVYSSDLSRAMETAAVLCRQNKLPLQVDKRLREVDVGPWEDQPFGNAAAEDPEQMAYFTWEPLKWNLPGADTFLSVADRAEAAMRDIVKKHPKGRVAVVAHGFLIGALLNRLFYGMDRPELSGKGTNTAVTMMTWDRGQFSLVYRHDASHLTGDQMRGNGFHTNRDMWLRPMASDAVEEYIRYRKDAWQVVYGNLNGFDGSGFWLDAQQTMGPDPAAMEVGYLDGRAAGMIQLSPRRDAEKGVGYIPFLYLREPYRHQGLGIQLIGHAVSFYRKLGRTRLQLSVAPTNEKALGFYHKFGFRQVKKHRGRFGYLLLMEKDIAPPTGPRDIEIIRV